MADAAMLEEDSVNSSSSSEEDEEEDQKKRKKKGLEKNGKKSKDGKSQKKTSKKSKKKKKKKKKKQDKGKNKKKKGLPATWTEKNIVVRVEIPRFTGGLPVLALELYARIKPPNGAVHPEFFDEVRGEKYDAFKSDQERVDRRWSGRL